MTRTVKVEDYLATTEHARMDEIVVLRAAILKSSKGITEHIKWNAPSFCWKGEDRVTMRLHPKDRLELIFHRGAKVKTCKPPAIGDPSGLITWVAADRGVLSIQDPSMLKARKSEIVRLVTEWMMANE
jgi:Domain of unknown function (DU1801)